MKIRNITNDRNSGGYLYSSETYHPETSHLPLEPWLGGRQLRLDEEGEFPDDLYFKHSSFLEDLKKHRILDFITPETPIKQEPIAEPSNEKAIEKIIEIEEGGEVDETVNDIKELNLEDTTLEEKPEVIETIKTVLKKGKKK